MNLKNFGIRSFRQKFFASNLILLVVFLGLVFPFVAGSVQKIVYNSMLNRADELIAKLLLAKDEKGLIQVIKNQKHYLFYRIGILDDEMHILYDTHTKSLDRPVFFPMEFATHPEVEAALHAGIGYAEEYSYLQDQKLIYLAKRFDFHGKHYIVRLAFPYQYTQELRRNFEIGFILFSSVVLILYSAMTGLVLNRLTNPIKKIIQSIKPYHEKEVMSLPKIELNTHPDDEFTHLANTLNSLSERIKRQLEMRKDFIANASHELKTPITVIRGFAETLHDNVSLPKEVIAEICDKIVKSCERMTKTIRNLLTLSDVENLPRSRISICDLVSLANICCENLISAHPKVEVSLAYDAKKSYEIAVDEELLEVAITNLLDNAAKYAKESAKIALSLERVPGYINIYVKDNGIGIPESDLEKIFQRFYRVNKMQSKRLGGSGLGLSIVEKIVQKHFGKISVSSRLGEGSCFTMQIVDDLETKVVQTSG